MSISDVIISDIRSALSEAKSVPFFFLLCGLAGSGKSTNLQAVGDSAVACGMRVIYGAPVVEDVDSAVTEWDEKLVRLFFLDYSALRSSDISTTTTVEPYPPGTVVLLDDIEAVDYLLRLHTLSYRLEMMVRRLLRSPRCALVTSAIDVHHVPRWLMDIWVPLTYQLQELTPSDARRCLCAFPDADASGASFVDEGIFTLLPYLRTQRALILALCHAKFVCPALQPVISSSARHFLSETSTLPQSLSSSVRLFGLDAVTERIQALLQLFMGREHLVGRSVLADFASTTGILLHGPSGSGKTALARQLDALCPGRFFFISCASLFSKYLGESEGRLRDAFLEARHRAPSVLVLDDVDVIGASRGSFLESGTGEGLDVTRRMLSALLCELDGLLENKRVLVIATTNTPDILDGALLRQGRLETLVYVPSLSFEAAREMSQEFFSAFDGATAEERDYLSLFIATHAEGCAAVSLKSFLRVVLEQQQQQQEQEEEGEGSGVSNEEEMVLSLPSEELVRGVLQETDILKPVTYNFSSL